MNRFRRVFIGDRAFYQSVLAIAVPVIIQNSVTNFVNLLDNIMVGQLGTEQMSGVSIANQMTFVFALCIFGGLSGPGIFGAQFYGAGDMEGLKNTFRIKIWFSLIITGLSLLVIGFWNAPLIRLFLTGDGDLLLAEGMLKYAQEYLYIMLLGLLPFALSMSYATTLRETGETLLPMKASIIAVLVNLVGNWLLIFGNLGFPTLGVKGAAVATVISRFAELGVMAAAVHHNDRFAFLHKAWQSLRVPAGLLRKVFNKGMPLLLNEALWSLGMTTLTQTASMRALTVLAALTISSTVSNLFIVFFLGIGNAVAVMVGHSLGAGNMKKAKEDVWKLIFLSFTVCLAVGAVMAALSPVFPRLYNVVDDTRVMAAGFILISAFLLPINAISHSSYFALRSGGSSLMTFLFDSAFTWVLMIPFTRILVLWTDLPVIPLMMLSQGTNLLKAAAGLLLVRSGLWVKNIVSSPVEGKQ